MNLSQNQSHFYELGVYLTKSKQPDQIEENVENHAICDVLCTTFQERFPSFVKKDVDSKLIGSLDAIESDIVKLNQSAEQRWDAYEKGRHNILPSLPRKRKNR